MISPGAATATPFDAHSPGARAIAELFTQTLIVCAVIFVVVAALVAWCVVRFRAKEGAPEPVQMHGHTRLEMAWTAIPLLIVTGLMVLTARTMAASDPPANREPDLTVIGHQWWWEVRYRSGAVSANEIHVPVGRELLVELQSADVIHDFWVPQLARKIDATPGHPTHLSLEVEQPGTYLGACAEYCGAQHAWMRISVVADPPEVFAAWEQHQLEAAPAPLDDASARGAQAFRKMTCARCHAIAGAAPGSDSPRAAPDLTHLADRKTLAAGLLDNTPENLARWLKDPQALKPGSHMPSLQLTPDVVGDLVAYFETLR